MDQFAYALIGIAAGFLGGLLGVGGGLVVVPSLLLMFHMHGFPSAMQTAIGTSLGAMVFTAASSAWAHFRQKGIDKDFLLLLSPGVFLGVISGALLADYLPGRQLELIFGLCISATGIYFFLPAAEAEPLSKGRPLNFVWMGLIGILIGGLSSLLGIGGGIITVPLLLAMQMPLRPAISTSAAVGFVIALVGAFSFLMLGLHKDTFKGSIGYIYLPAFLLISLTSSLAAPYGAKCAYRWPTTWLRRIFGVFLMMVGLFILLSGKLHLFFLKLFQLDFNV